MWWLDNWEEIWAITQSAVAWATACSRFPRWMHRLGFKVLLPECSTQRDGPPIQIKSNHFYCHITTAQVPWWVKFLWACSRQCKKKKKNTKQNTTIYIWTVHIYRLYRRQCAKYTYIYSVHIVYYKDIPNYQLHIIHRMGTSTLCTLQWGKKVFSQPPIVQVLPLKKMRGACNFHHRYTSTMRDKIRKKIPEKTL